MDNNKNTGNWNTGDCNTGDCNTGNCNTGNRNTGDWNTGNWNTGDWNTGNCNTGNRNTGDCNTGNWNTGNWNTGNWNTGDCNTGDCNTGNCNTGNRNTGNWNTGDWNTGDWNTGYFNNTTLSETLIFGKLYNRIDFLNMIKPKWIYFTLTKWININEMNDKEKSEFTSWETCGGYLRTYSYKEAAKLSWEATSDEDKILTYTLPNFDADIAQDIFGIDFKEYLHNSSKKSEDKKESIDIEIITVNGVKYKKID